MDKGWSLDDTFPVAVSLQMEGWVAVVHRKVHLRRHLLPNGVSGLDGGGEMAGDLGGGAERSGRGEVGEDGVVGAVDVFVGGHDAVDLEAVLSAVERRSAGPEGRDLLQQHAALGEVPGGVVGRFREEELRDCEGDVRCKEERPS